MGLIRFVVVGLVVLTVIYVSISVYSRSVRREKLEKEFDARPDAQPGAQRDAFIAEGMHDYENSLRKKLIWLVYILPIVAVAVILYVTNAN